MFSAVIASKRSFGHFKKAIESVQLQTYKNTEILVTDDASGEGEAKAEFLASQDIIFNIQINATSVGFAAARNQAIAKAKGEWIAILDDDDEWSPQYLADAVDALAEPWSWSYCLPTADKILGGYVLERDIPQIIHRLLYSGIGPGSGLIFSRKAIEAVGFFDPAFKVVADRDLMQRS